MVDRWRESKNVLIQNLRENAKLKIPNKGKTTGLKSGFQKQMWKYELETLIKS